MRKDHIGIKIRERRKELGLKVYELANKVGINPVYVTQIEKHGKLPSSEVFYRIENVLSLPLEVRKQFFKSKYPEIYRENNDPKFFTGIPYDVGDPEKEFYSLVNEWIAFSGPKETPKKEEIAEEIFKLLRPSTTPKKATIIKIASLLEEIRKLHFEKDKKIKNLKNIIQSTA